jgi:hypothetical protein
MTKELGILTSSMIHSPPVLAVLSINRLVNHADRLTNLVEGDVEVRDGALDLVPSDVHRGNRIPQPDGKSSGSVKKVLENIC